MLVRRSPGGVHELGRTSARAAAGFHLTLRAVGRHPTTLTAAFDDAAVTAAMRPPRSSGPAIPAS